MAIFNAAQSYAAFVEIATAIGEIGTVIYWDDVANSGQFRSAALVDGGRSCVFYAEGSLVSPPASFATDFPNAIALSDSFSLI